MMKEENKKIKVLQISGGLSAEGIGVFLLNTFDNIDKEKYEIHFALSTRYKQIFEDRILIQGGKIIRTHELGEGIKGKMKHLLNLYKLLKKEKYDVVHSHMDFFNGLNLLTAFLAGVPLRISHAHIANNINSSFLAKFYYLLMKILILMFSNNRLGCSIEANRFVNGKGKVIFNGIDIDQFSNKHQLFPKDIRLDVQKKNIITVGRIDDAKNPFFIIEIIEELKKLTSDFHFYWVGFGSLSKEVENLIFNKKLENEITLLGIRSDVATILTKMDFFILPSKYEGFGIVLAEAQAAGLRCLISEKVPSEANLGLCEIICLKDGAKIWAKRMNAYPKNVESINNIDLTKIDIKNTTLALQKEYMIQQ